MLRRVLSILLSALITCAASLVLGQGVLRLCGWPGWSWLSAPVGVSTLMLLASPALHVPGRSVTCGIVIGLAVIAAAALLLRERPSSLRPPLFGLACGLWPFALGLVPFLVAGRSGILGVSVINDMTQHLLWVEGIMSQRIIDTSGFNNSYPLGPHFLVAALAAPTGIDPELAFGGVLVALPVLLGWTAVAAIRNATASRQFLAVAVCGMPFLIASYYGESGFKEISVAMLVLAFAIMLDDVRTFDRSQARKTVLSRWVPMAVVAAGVVSVYSYTGVLWLGALVLCWGVTLVGVELYTRGSGLPRVASRAVQAEIAPIGIALVTFALVLGPQWPRTLRYAGNAVDTGGVIASNDTGNLVARISPWESFGMWDNPDFRFPPHDGLAVGVWSGLVLALVLVGAPAWIRRDRWMIPLGTVSAWLIWVYTDRTQSIYVGPKALAVMSPLLLLTALGLFMEGPRLASRFRFSAVLLPVVALVFVYKISSVSFQALRHAPVGPLAHAKELRHLRHNLSGTTLFMGVDDFAQWELAGKRVKYLLYDLPQLPMRPQKAWKGGHAVDIDVFPADFLNTFNYVLTPKDAAGSALPPQLRLIAETQNYALYRRGGTIAPRQILNEGEGSAAVLDCRNDPAARRLSHREGTAAIQEGGVAVPVPALFAGADRTVNLPLPRAGTWDIVMAYSSALPITISAPGMKTAEMVPNLDRPGPRYPVGTIRTSDAHTVPVRFQVNGHPLSSTAAPAVPTAFIAVPRGTEHTVPLRRACGKAVDYYRLAQ
jgi:hypothetical protein